MNTINRRIHLVVFDWGGTTIDHGCFAPVVAFVKSFSRRGVDISPDEARVPMGLHKKDHIRELLRMPAVGERWRRTTGKPWNESDVESLYNEFIPLQLAAIGEHSQIVDGVPQCCEELRRRGIKIGTTTGFFREAARLVFEKGTQQGFLRHVDVCADDVSIARPAPFMIYRIMEQTGVYPAAHVVKVGDTVPDIEEGLHAGTWSIGVTGSSSDVGLSPQDLARMAETQRRELLDRHRQCLLRAGAHQVIDSIAELPGVIDEIETRLQRGQRPT